MGYTADMPPVSPKPGRPPLHGRAKLAVVVRLRVLRAESASWKKAARRAGKSLSEWIREAANRAATN